MHIMIMHRYYLLRNGIVATCYISTNFVMIVLIDNVSEYTYQAILSQQW